MTRNNKFWIPNNEMQDGKIKRTPRSERYPVTIEQAGRIVDSLDEIREGLNKYIENNDDEEAFFILETKKQSDSYEPIIKNGLEPRYRLSDKKCLVSASLKSMDNMSGKARQYRDTFHDSKKRYTSNFNHVVDFLPNTDYEIKMSKSIKKKCESEQKPIEYRVMVYKNNSRSTKPSGYYRHLMGTIEKSEARIMSQLPMDDGTEFLEVESNIDTLREICGNPAVLAATEISRIGIEEIQTIQIETRTLGLDPSIDITKLGIVAILDTGVRFPKNLEPLIVEHYVDDDVDDTFIQHGTWVASKAAFGNISDSGILTPRNRILDCKIFNEGCTTQDLAKRLEKVVVKYHDMVKIYNISINAEKIWDPIGVDPLTKKVDYLQYLYGVQIVVSMGNHRLWKTSDDLSQMFEDDDTLMRAPADSLLGISVGSLSGYTYEESLSIGDNPSPYSCKGALVNRNQKPDIVAYGGGIDRDSRVPMDEYSRMVTTEGFAYNVGTSFVAPYTAGILEEIRKGMGDDGILVSKALLYSELKKVEWKADSEYVRPVDLLGYGLLVRPDLTDNESKAILMRLDSIEVGKEKTISIAAPKIALPSKKKDRLDIKVTCISMCPIEYGYGSECVRVNIVPFGPNLESESKANNNIWSPIHIRTFKMKELKDDDWMIRLECKGKEEMSGELIEYALVITISDPNGADVCSYIRSTNRYPEMVSVREMIRLYNRENEVSKVKLSNKH